MVAGGSGWVQDGGWTIIRCLAPRLSGTYMDDC